MTKNIKLLFFKSILLLGVCFVHTVSKASLSGVRILSPNGDATVYNQQSLVIDWETPDSTITDLTISIIDVSNQEHILATNVPNTGSYTLTNQLNGYVGAYKVKIKETGGDATDEGNGQITFVDLCLKSEYNANLHYAGLNTKLNRTSFKTNTSLLCFRIQEQARAQGVSRVTIFDTKHNTKAVVGLEKSFGYNFYALDLTSPTLQNQGLTIEENNTYFMEVADGYGNKKSLKFQYTIVPDISNDIVGNIQFANCETSNATEIEYLPAVFEGTAPYTIEWYISSTQNEAEATRTQKTTIAAQRATPDAQFGNIDPQLAKFIVTDDPGYYVILKVTDNCGKVARKVAYITCGENNNSNTISIQLLDNTTNNSTQTY